MDKMADLEQRESMSFSYFQLPPEVRDMAGRIDEEVTVSASA